VAAQQLPLEMRFEVRGFESHLKQFFFVQYFFKRALYSEAIVLFTHPESISAYH